MIGFDALVLDTLQTIETAASLVSELLNTFHPKYTGTILTLLYISNNSKGPGSLGAYVISQSRAASDVLAVMLLQKQFGMTG
jgi:phosphoenolpyruvate carboxylase